MDKNLVTGELRQASAPALIIVDMSLGFTSADSPLGGEFGSQIAATNQLIAFFEQHHWPIFCSTVVYDDSEQASIFRSRLPDLNILQRGSDWVRIDPQLQFTQGYTLVEKQLPSAFFDTCLAGQLNKLAVDTCVVVGLTTSGCVRATAVDALQHNFTTIVVKEGCGDRNISAHHASLHDIHAKYGLVISLDELPNYMPANTKPR